MVTFGLVHGGFHGGWCWDHLVPELEALGHQSVTMDMPIDRADATLQDYVDAVVEAMADVEGPVVMVGHSMGGLVIPHVALARPVEHMVFICAMYDEDNLPEAPPGVEIPDLERLNFDMSLLSVDAGFTTVDREGAKGAFFPDCDPADAAWAVAQLKPQGHAPAIPLAAPWPDVPSTLIVCTDDRGTEFTRRCIAPRLEVEPIELPGGHSPFLSRPAHLAQVLDEVAITVPAS
jgi:pimeloyl-ACP methyl ester carboxylesterase